MRVYFFLFVLISFNNVYSQSELESKTLSFIEDNEYTHNLEQEKFFLHTNKNVYYSGEKIWFKAYIVSDTYDTPYNKTTNLNVNLYDANRQLISHNLFYVENGRTDGEIELPIRATSGQYFLQVDTHWNKNFKDKYIRPIKVINLRVKSSSLAGADSATKENEALSVKFYPESGILLENAENNIAVVSKINNTPIAVKGEIIDRDTNSKIADFASDKQGLGVIKLFYPSSKNYNAVIEYDGEKKTIALPASKKEGLVIEKKESQPNPNAVSFRIKTNEKTLLKEVGNYLYAVLHRKGVVKSIMPFKLDAQYVSYSIDFLKDDLYNGVNALTLFNELNQPVAERLFFHNDKSIDLSINTTKQIGDSISLNFDPLKIDTDLNFSISVLPQESKNYINTNNILTDFLIKPYINQGDLSLNHVTKNKLDPSSIDQYLMSRINTNSFSNKHLNSNKPNYAFEVGVQINGNVYTKYKKLEKCKIMLSSQENNLLLVKPIKDKNRFTFDSIYLKHPSNYKLALIDAKGNVLKAAFSVSNKLINYTADNTLEVTEKRVPSNPDMHDITQIRKKRSKKVERLDEVVVVAEKEELEYADLMPDPKIIGDTFTKKYKVDENFYLGNNTAFDVIKDLPGVQANLVGGIPMIRSTRGQKSIKESRVDPEGRSNFDMTVILNGTEVQDLRLLYSLRASEIKDIKVNGLGGGYGITGINGVIVIETKGIGEDLKVKINPSKSHKISATEFGFSMPLDQYENFQLNFPNETSKKYFSTIDWVPNFDIKSGEPNNLKINLDGHNDIKLVINGFSKNGDLIFKEIDISANSN